MLIDTSGLFSNLPLLIGIGVGLTSISRTLGLIFGIVVIVLALR